MTGTKISAAKRITTAKEKQWMQTLTKRSAKDCEYDSKKILI